MVEHLTVDQGVTGSNPVSGANQINNLVRRAKAAISSGCESRTTRKWVDGAAAAALLRPAASIYRLQGERHQQGRTLQKLAIAVGHDDPTQGAAIAERAVALVEGGSDPRLELAACHTLTWLLNDSGQAWAALDLFERSLPLYHKCGDSEPQLLMPWLEGRICRRLGELAVAERRFGEAWHRFRAAGFRQEQTLVCLDLAEVWTAQGKRRPAVRNGVES